LCRSRQPATDILPLLIIVQVSKTLLTHLCTHPLGPPISQTGNEKACTALMLQLVCHTTDDTHFYSQSMKNETNRHCFQPLKVLSAYQTGTDGFPPSRLFISAPQPPGRFPGLRSKWFLLIKHSRNSLAGKTTALACTSPTLHPSPELARRAGVIREKPEALFVYERRRFVQMKVKAFHGFTGVEMCVITPYILVVGSPGEKVLLS